jgi:hypothetical protein
MIKTMPAEFARRLLKIKAPVIIAQKTGLKSVTEELVLI